MRTLLILAGAFVFLACVAFGCSKNERHPIQTSDLPAHEEAAIVRAKEVARQNGYNVADYTHSVSRADQGWFVVFKHKTPGLTLGGDTQFTVRVDDDGTTQVFRGR